ncbi:hypothetical protein ZYGNAAKF_CDS0179 [Enterococcus phage VRE9_2]
MLFYKLVSAYKLRQIKLSIDFQKFSLLFQ